MINRAALFLKAKDPFVRWINESDPYDKSPNISKAEVNQDRIVYLLNEQDAENLDKWIALNYAALFESELDGWYTDESLGRKKGIWNSSKNGLMLNAIPYSSIPAPGRLWTMNRDVSNQERQCERV